MLNMPTAARDVIAINDVCDELKRARSKHCTLNSAHEAYAVILEELDEYWEQVRLRRQDRDRAKMRLELVQIGAMAIRAISDLNLGTDDAGDVFDAAEKGGRS